MASHIFMVNEDEKNEIERRLKDPDDERNKNSRSMIASIKAAKSAKELPNEEAEWLEYAYSAAILTA
jgi:hypothetical protein